MHERAIAPGLLLAMPQLLDPNFARSVVLMIDHAPGKDALGLVVNRPTELRSAEVMQTLGLQWRGTSEAPVWLGGPCETGTGWLLHQPVEHEDRARTIVPGLELTTSPEVLKSVVERPPAELRFLLGYAGWEVGQLEGELAQGAWLLAEATPELVFHTPADEMWEAALATLGVDPLSLVPSSGLQ